MVPFFTYLNDCNSLWASIDPSQSVRAVYNAEEILEIDFPTPTSKNLLHLCSKKVFNCCLSINVTHYRYISSFSSYYLKCSFFTLSSDVHQYPTRRRNDFSLLFSLLSYSQMPKLHHLQRHYLAFVTKICLVLEKIED